MALAPLCGVVVDCPDPAALASFYRGIAGGEVVEVSADFVALTCAPIGLGFQRAADPAPRRPDPPEPLRVHADFAVDDAGRLDEVERQAVALGARRAATQPRPESWRVLLDPAGHPFCLTALTG